jgi:hypothetical protein
MVDLPADEEATIAAARAGDRAALAALVRRRRAWIYNIALKMVWDPSAAEDVAQEISDDGRTSGCDEVGADQLAVAVWRLLPNEPSRQNTMPRTKTPPRLSAASLHTTFSTCASEENRVSTKPT